MTREPGSMTSPESPRVNLGAPELDGSAGLPVLREQRRTFLRCRDRPLRVDQVKSTAARVGAPANRRPDRMFREPETPSGGVDDALALDGVDDGAALQELASHGMHPLFLKSQLTGHVGSSRDAFASDA